MLGSESHLSPMRSKSPMDTREFLRRLPKAELHLHLEGTLEPDMLMRLAQKNGVEVPYEDVAEVAAAYRFTKLQDFLDIYYQGMAVLREEEDFHDLTLAYLERAAADGVVHVEVFFDPQGHTGRGLPFSVAADGILSGLAKGKEKFGITSHLILCFLRHLSEEEGFATYRQAEAYFGGGHILGVGLDSSETDHPPEKFERLFAAAKGDGLKVVAHAGEEGPATYVRQAIELLQVDRIDHGNRAMEDPALVRLLAESGMALTLCPLSNLRLCVVNDLREHPLKNMLSAGMRATVNSDDPSYFGGYLLDNFIAMAEALQLNRQELRQLAQNSITGAFLDEASKARHLASLDQLSQS